MTEDRTSVVQPDGRAAPVGQGRAPCGTGHERAAIVIVCRDAMAREAVSRELSGRYGMHYRIVVCDDPAELEAVVIELLAADTPVALVIGGVGETDPDGIELLARVRVIDRTVPRVAAVRWGEWDTARPIFDAVTMGKIDHWVTCPVQSPDEQFHESITRFLSEWSGRHGGSFEPVQVIGEHWSARSQELRDTFPGMGSRSASVTRTPSEASSCSTNSVRSRPNCQLSSSASAHGSRPWSTRRTWRSPKPSA